MGSTPVGLSVNSCIYIYKYIYTVKLVILLTIVRHNQDCVINSLCVKT